MQDFDFDYWSKLATSSPGEFEVQRRKALQEVVDTAPEVHQPALSTLLETLCAPQHGAPMERAINAQTLMLESLGYLKTAWVDLAAATGEGSVFDQALQHARVSRPSQGPNTVRP